MSQVSHYELLTLIGDEWITWAAICEAAKSKYGITGRSVTPMLKTMMGSDWIERRIGAGNAAEYRRKKVINEDGTERQY